LIAVGIFTKQKNLGPQDSVSSMHCCGVAIVSGPHRVSVTIRATPQSFQSNSIQCNPLGYSLHQDRTRI
jgi:hypothetical protein